MEALITNAVTDFAAAVSSGEQKELQEVLGCLNVEERMQKALVVHGCLAVRRH